MKIRKQTQRAGENSSQLSVAGDLHVGVTAADAIRISEVVAQKVIAEYSAEALDVANERIAEFGRRLVAEMADNGRLESFRDPAFQVLVKKAQRSAASTDRESDFDQLAGLLATRSETDDRLAKAAIDQAVQVVDLVDDSAVRAMAASRLLQLRWSLDGLVGMGIDRFERFAAATVDGDLPEGGDWIEHADSLGLIRIAQAETFHSASQIATAIAPGYVCPGISDEDPAAQAAAIRDLTFGPRAIPLVPHELKPGFKRLPISSEGHVRQIIEGNRPHLPELDVLLPLLATHGGFPGPDRELLPRLLEEYRARPALGRMLDWWDAQPLAYRFTRSGTLLAAAYSKNALRQAGLSSD